MAWLKVAPGIGAGFNWGMIRIWALRFAMFVVYCLSLAFVLELVQRGGAIPIGWNGDALHHLALAKGLAENGWWWKNPQLSYPFEYRGVLFPVAGNLDILGYWIFSRFTAAPIAIITSYFFLASVLSFISASWMLRRVGFGEFLSLALGVLFALSPFTFWRNTTHLMLVTYFVPVGAGAALLLSSRVFDARLKRPWIFAVLFFLMGFNYVYTTFFACFFVASAVLLRWLAEGWSWRVMRTASMWIAAALIGTGIGLAPTVMAWHEDPEAAELVNSAKSAYQADVFGLKIRDLLAPVPDHWFPPLAKVTDEITDAHFPIDNENVAARMGLIASIGFLFLLFSLLKPAVYSVRVSEDSQLASGSARLVFLALLLATIGGFGSFFNLFVSPDIRCYNRISIFIAFYSLVAFGLLWKRIEARFERRAWLAPAVLGLILLYGISDQIERDRFAPIDETRAELSSLKSFVGEIEASGPQKIYQYPYQAYPNTPQQGHMPFDALFKPYLVSQRSQFAWPTLSSEAFKWNVHVMQLQAPALVQELREKHFTGLWLDNEAFDDDGRAVREALGKVLSLASQTSSDGRYTYFPL